MEKEFDLKYYFLVKLGITTLEKYNIAKAFYINNILSNV